MSFEGWYAFDHIQQAGISFGGSQAIAFGRDNSGNQVWLNLVDEGVSWAAFLPDGNGGMKRVGSVRIEQVSPGVLELDSDIVSINGPVFSPPPPALFSGRATKLVLGNA